MHPRKRKSNSFGEIIFKETDRDRERVPENFSVFSFRGDKNDERGAKQIYYYK